MKHAFHKSNRTADRLVRLAGLVVALAMLALMGLASSAFAGGIKAVSCVSINVEDADHSIDFYTQVLSFIKTDDREIVGKPLEQLQGLFGARVRVVHLQLGAEEIRLVQYLTPAGRQIPRDSRSNDLWFQHIAIITSDMDRAYEVLRAHKVRYASPSPQTLPDWNRNAAGIKAFYFRDPDDHVLEVLQFPTDKGLPQWHAKDRLFLGIDHTAIVVSSTEASLAFYRDFLGMHVAGESENFGDEQEHLNNVYGAHLRITTLRADAGPGVELLEYLMPRDGRPYPTDARSNDLFNWETVVASPVVDDLYEQSRVDHRTIVSAGVVEDAVSRAFIVRDPDGHVVKIVQPGPR